MSWFLLRRCDICRRLRLAMLVAPRFSFPWNGRDVCLDCAAGTVSKLVAARTLVTTGGSARFGG